MLRNLTTNQRAILTSMAVSICGWWYLSVIRDALGANCNQNCEARWVTITEIHGGIACEHGYEFDPDCPQEDIDWETDCWEANGNMGDCKCYECGNATNCEGDVRVYKAWCGKEVTGYNVGDCPKQDDVIAHVKEERSASVAGGGACNYGGNGFNPVPACGGGRTASSCKSSNCEGSGPWMSAGDPEMRKKCGAPA